MKIAVNVTIDIERTLNEFALKNVKRHIEKMRLKNEIIVFVKNDILGIVGKIVVFRIRTNVRKNIEVIQYMMNQRMHVDVNHDMNGILLVLVA